MLDKTDTITEAMPTLREIRTKKAMSQEELAKAAGVAVATIASIESGKRTPNFKTRRKLASALKTPVEKINFEG